MQTSGPLNVPTSPAMEPSQAAGWGRNGTLADRAAMVTVAADGATLHTRAPMKLVGRMAAAHTNAMMVVGGRNRENDGGGGRNGGGRAYAGGGRDGAAGRCGWGGRRWMRRRAIRESFSGGALSCPAHVGRLSNEEAPLHLVRAPLPHPFQIGRLGGGGGGERGGPGGGPTAGGKRPAGGAPWGAGGGCGTPHVGVSPPPPPVPQSWGGGGGDEEPGGQVVDQTTCGNRPAGGAQSRSGERSRPPQVGVCEWGAAGVGFLCRTGPAGGAGSKRARI